MIVEFGKYKVDIDVQKTKQYYKSAEFVSASCSCDGCLNFEKAVEVLPQSVTMFFSNLGIDIRKTSECYVICTNSDGTLFYGGFCHVCGALLSGKSVLKKNDDKMFCRDEDATFAVSSDFHISFKEDIDLPETNFPLPVIQLDFFANIPWVLNKENTYL